MYKYGSTNVGDALYVGHFRISEMSTTDYQRPNLD